MGEEFEGFDGSDEAEDNGMFDEDTIEFMPIKEEFNPTAPSTIGDVGWTTAGGMILFAGLISLFSSKTRKS